MKQNTQGQHIATEYDAWLWMWLYPVQHYHWRKKMALRRRANTKHKRRPYKA